MGGKIKQQDKSGFRKRCEPWQHCHGNGGPASACCSLAQAPWAPWHTVIQDGEGWCHGETVLFLLEVSRGHRRCSGSWWQGEREAAVGHKSLLGRIQPPVPPLCPPHQQLPAWLLLDGARRPWGRLVMLLDSRDSPLGKNTEAWAVLEFPQGVKPGTFVCLSSQPNTSRVLHPPLGQHPQLSSWSQQLLSIPTPFSQLPACQASLGRHRKLCPRGAIAVPQFLPCWWLWPGFGSHPAPRAFSLLQLLIAELWVQQGEGQREWVPWGSGSGVGMCLGGDVADRGSVGSSVGCTLSKAGSRD